MAGYFDEILASIRKPIPVVSGEEFCFAAAGLDHGHIDGMTAELIRAGAKLLYVYDRDSGKAERMAAKYGAAAVRDFDEIFEDERVKLVASAAIPNERGPLGCEVMRRGRDYFVDKCPFTTLEQLAEAKRTAAETGKHYFCDYSERLHSEVSILAGYLVEAGFIGKVVNLIGTGPHRLSGASRPDWFFRRAQYGGILTDIGSHQAEQFLFYSGCDRAKVTHSAIGNFDNPDTPELDDFGEMHLTAENGVTGYHRVDWYTPDGLRTWGDGRCVLEGTKGFIEMRKYNDLTRGGGNLLFLVNDDGEFRLDAGGTTGFPFFGEMILDCLSGEWTGRAMSAEHTFAAAELSLLAQRDAVELTGRANGSV